MITKKEPIPCAITMAEMARIIQSKTQGIEDPRLKRLAILEVLNEIMLATALPSHRNHPAYRAAMETKVSRLGLKPGHVVYTE